MNTAGSGRRLVLRPSSGKSKKLEARIVSGTDHSEDIPHVEENPHKVPETSRKEIQRLARQYTFFHWHLAFPDVFQPRETINRRPYGLGRWLRRGAR